MNLWAISDLHVGYEDNRRAVPALEPMPEDLLILAGDTGETPAHLDFVLKSLVQRLVLSLSDQLGVTLGRRVALIEHVVNAAIVQRVGWLDLVELFGLVGNLVRVVGHVASLP